MTNQPRQSASSLPGTPIFLADQLRAIGHDPADIVGMLRKGGGTVRVASPTGVTIDLSLDGDRVRLNRLVLTPGVKVLNLDGDYNVHLTPPHNDFPETLKAALPGRPLSDLFKAPGFDRADVRMGSVRTLQSNTLLIGIDCPREPD